jgi:hypothetical protein
MSFPISIIVAGDKTDVGKAFIATAKSDTWELYTLFDVREWLKRDPTDSDTNKSFFVSHWENSDSLSCQVDLLTHPSFVDCCKAVARRISESHMERKVYVLYCSAGQHRSDAVAKAIQTRIFNSTPDESRVFNCNVFTLSGAKVADVVVDEAFKFLKKPWVLVNHTEFWGRRAHFANNRAHAALATIDALGTVIHSRIEGTDLASHSQPLIKPLPIGGRPRQSSERASTKAMPKRARVDEGDSRASVDEGDGRDACGEEKCPLCDGTGIATELPTVDTTEVWMKVLESRTVDESARLDWCALYSADPTGKKEGLSIIHKILKKESGKHQVDNPSAFVVSSVKNSWRQIRP